MYLYISLIGKMAIEPLTENHPRDAQSAVTSSCWITMLLGCLPRIKRSGTLTTIAAKARRS